MTLTHSPEKEIFESLWVGTHKHRLEFFSENDAYSFPEIDFLKILLDFFFQKWRLLIPRKKRILKIYG